MATKIQIKRSSVSGVTPTTGDISVAELAVNLADKKLFTSNGSSILELGSNLTNLSVSSNLTVSSVIANGTAGASGEVLTSNGTSTYWSAITTSGGSSAYFNTGANNNVGYAVNTSMAAAYTAPSTAGIEYIIYSIHVTNIGSANTFVSGEFEGTTYANISFSTSVPVPVGSSVELLKMPKIMQPSDILKLQANNASTLHAVITYESQSSTSYFGSGVDVTADAAYTDLYTASSGAAVVQSILLSNDDGVNDVKARVVWTDGSNNIQGYYCYDLIVPADSTVELLEQIKYLPSGHKIRVYANVGNRLEAIIAGKLV